MGGGKVGTHFIKRLQQGWDVKTLLYYGATDSARALKLNSYVDSRALGTACSGSLSQKAWLRRLDLLISDMEHDSACMEGHDKAISLIMRGSVS
jgi:hypothetical protein